MFVLGVTGNIGSGKSTVGKRLAELGAVVSHSDDLAKEILQNDPNILKHLSIRFGSDIQDESGKLQRHVLAERAFASTEDQQYLNNLIHPEVRKVTLSRIKAAQEDKQRLFVIDAPLLFEAGVDKICNMVLVVTADLNFRKARVNQRSQISDEDFRRRDNLQLSIEEKINRADHIIHNNGSLDELIVQVDELYRQLIPIEL